MRRSSEYRWQENNSLATRIEAAQEGPDEAVTQALAASSAREALAASSARNVRPRIAESSRMDDVFTVETARIREVGPSGDPMRTPADKSQMGISEMAVILMSLGVAPANFKVSELCSAGTDFVMHPSTWASSAASWWTVREAGTLMMWSRRRRLSSVSVTKSQRF